MESLVLRGYRKTDLEAMFQLDEQCFEDPFRFTRQAMRRFAEAKHARVAIVEAGIVLAGFAILHIERIYSEVVGYIVTLDVAESLRRHGIARMLMVEMERHAIAEGCAAMELHVYTGNAGAIRFYESEGYRRVHTAFGFYAPGLDAWVYRKEMSLN